MRIKTPIVEEHDPNSVSSLFDVILMPYYVALVTARRVLALDTIRNVAYSSKALYSYPHHPPTPLNWYQGA